jgi:predicted PurR-regulated permease PerM
MADDWAGDRTMQPMNDQMKPPAWLWRWTIGALVLTWSSVLLVNSLRALHDVLVILIVSLLVACALEQPVTLLSRRGVRRGVATFAVLAGGLLSAIGVLALGGTVIIGQFASLREASPDLVRSAAGWAASFGISVDADAVATEVSQWLSTAVQENAGSLVLQASVMAGNVAIGALLVFYLVADGPRLRRNVCSLLPPTRQQQVLDVWTAAIEKAGGYFIVRALLAAVAAVVSWLVFSLLGVPYALALAVWVGVVSQAIPAVGTYLAGALPILVMSGSSAGRQLAIVSFLVIYQQIENYFLTPRLNRHVMQVHPAVAFLTAICGAVLAGFAGALIAVPLVATVQAVLAASVERHQLVESDLLKGHEPVRREPRTKTIKKPRTGRNRNDRTKTDRTATERGTKKDSRGK